VPGLADSDSVLIVSVLWMMSPNISESSMLDFGCFEGDLTPKWSVDMGPGLTGERPGVWGPSLLVAVGRAGVPWGVIVQVISVVCAISKGTLSVMKKLDCLRGVFGADTGA
jgi:hypothetical protein